MNEESPAFRRGSVNELPAEVREKAARAAQNRVGRVAYEYWTEVVDAVSEVLAEHPGATSAAGSARWVRVASLVDKEGFPTEAVIDAVADLVDERDDLRAERDKWEKLVRSCGTHAEKWMNTAKKMDRKLSRQRKRRKAAEVRELETRVELEFLSVHAGQVAAERDALQARVESLRAALEQGAGEDICEVYTPATGWTDCRDAKEREAWCPACVNRDALAADDRAAGRTEEKT